MTLAGTISLAGAAQKDWGAVVVGAGPAGALVARELARRDVRVLLVERSAFPRHKVCGCCLNGRALATLQSVGLGDLPASCGAVPLARAHLANRHGGAEVALPVGVALSRESFDTALVRAAIQAGASFLPQTRAALAGGPATHRLVRLVQREAETDVRARVVLAADGLGGQFLARAGLGAAPAVAGARLGAGVVIESEEKFYRAGTIFMACGRAGYVGLVRLEDDRLDIAAALDAGAVRKAGGPGVAAVGVLAEVGWPVPPGLSERPWRGTPALTRRSAHVAAPRAFALGDATGYVEPFTGEGMAWALSSAVAVAPLAAQAAERWRPALVQRWHALHRQLVGRRQYACRAMAAVLRRPLLTRLLIGALARAPALARPVVSYLNHAPRITS